jgi:hypothetical protein
MPRCSPVPIDNQFKLGRLQIWEIGRLRSAKHLVDVVDGSRPQPGRPQRRRSRDSPSRMDSNQSLPTFEPVSVREREFRQEKVAEARDSAGIFSDIGRFRSTETVLSSVSDAKAAESQRLFRRRRETGVVQDCVVELAGLEPATKRLFVVMNASRSRLHQFTNPSI